MENKKIGRKGAGYITNTIISLLLFSAALMAIMMFYANVVSDTSMGYGYLNITTDPRFDNFNKNVTATFNDMVGQAPEMEKEFTDSSSTKDSGENNMVTNSFSSVKTIFSNTFTNMNNIGGVIVTELGIPSYWQKLFWTIVVVVIFVAVLAGFMRATSW